LSCDFGVWEHPKITTVTDARATYLELCAGNNSKVLPSKKVAAFMQDLDAAFPDINIDPNPDSSPWSCGHTVSIGSVVMSCRWSVADNMEDFVRRLASKHGLIFYNPQLDTVNF